MEEWERKGETIRRDKRIDRYEWIGERKSEDLKGECEEKGKELLGMKKGENGWEREREGVSELV